MNKSVFNKASCTLLLSKILYPNYVIFCFLHHLFAYEFFLDNVWNTRCTFELCTFWVQPTHRISDVLRTIFVINTNSFEWDVLLQLHEHFHLRWLHPWTIAVPHISVIIVIEPISRFLADAGFSYRRILILTHSNTAYWFSIKPHLKIICGRYTLLSVLYSFIPVTRLIYRCETHRMNIITPFI